MGPQHPSTHGVFRLKLYLQGERINKVESFLGYLHRGVEKLSEKLDYDQLPPVLERDDYLSPTSNSLGFCNAVEKICDIKVSRKASYIRVLVAELQRISSHLVALGTYGLDLGGALGGGASLFLYCFREREKILDIMEDLTGTRFHTNMNQIGGVRYDVTTESINKIKKLSKDLRPVLQDFANMVSKDEIFMKRTKDIGIISKALAEESGGSGPIARGSGINFDVRKNKPYECYSEFNFDIPLGVKGDAYDRNVVKKYFNNVKFDVILDDGSHKVGDQIKFLNLYSDLLTDDGILIIEDIATIRDAKKIINNFKGKINKCSIIDRTHCVPSLDDINVIYYK